MKSNVRTFRASSPREALELVKRELGPSAVILGTRSVSVGGLGSLAGRKGVEITAGPASMSSPAPRLRRRTAEPVDPRPERPADGDKPELPRHLYRYYVRLVQDEVAEELALRLVRQAAAQVGGGDDTDEEVLRRALCQYIASMMPESHGVDLRPDTTRRVALVGPSGSGKTTTLAKLAARFKLKEGKQVALLSLDMQRVGAHQQLRRYAEIIDVPLHVAQTISEVKECLKGLESVDLLLIDTPGVGLREQGLFARLATLLRAARPEEIYLVLPVSTAPEVLTRMARGFAPLGPAGLVLTRLDDVIGLGVILNVMQRLDLSLSYLTTGQNVPNDIEEACGERVAELVLAADR